MAKPRVFISSTFYDLRHIRSDLERFILEMGYDPIRNENGDIPYGVTSALEEYCYKEVEQVDILIGIIGSRFGSESKVEKHSITQLEIKTAYELGKQVYLFVDKNVYSEYETYLLNKPEVIKYKYVDNIKIYEFIEEIKAIKAGIIIQPFENIIEVTSYLKLQWAGLLRDLLRKNSESQQLNKLGTKIDDLESITETLKSYIEKSLPTLLENKETAESYIKVENEKIDERKINNRLVNINFVNELMISNKLKLSEIKLELQKSATIFQFFDYLINVQKYNPESFTVIMVQEIIQAGRIVGKTSFGEVSYGEIREYLQNKSGNTMSYVPHNSHQITEN